MGWLARPLPASGRVVPQLDALRGLAILAVFAQHEGDRFRPMIARDLERSLPTVAPWIMTVLHHAWWGVDLFFVVSGFSLSLGYLRALDAGRSPMPAREFFARRAARIFPGFLVAIAVVLAATPALASAKGFGVALLAHLVLLQGYVSPGGVVLIGAAWSLTTEAHFYLALPLLARPVLARSARRRRWWIGGGICALVWLCRAVVHDVVLEPGVVTSLLETTQRHWISSRLDQFVLGMLAAAVWSDVHPRARGPVGAALAGASVAMLVVSFKLEGELYTTRGGAWPYALVSFATAALVLGCALADGAWLRLVAPAPLRALGVVSYGVFLYHQLALRLVGELGPAAGEPSWGRLAWSASFALSLSIVLGAASWVLVEKPWIARASAGHAKVAVP